MADQVQLRRAEDYLGRVDAVMRVTIADCGPCRLDKYQRRGVLPALIQTIIGQQISIAAASAIHSRLLTLYGGRAPSARALLRTSDQRLRDAGLSRQKVRTFRDLATRVTTRQLNLSALERSTDDDVVEELSQVIGIGAWTAQVFMIFRLGRLDVLPVADLGLLDGAQVLYGLKQRPSAAELTELAVPWRPYRSVACWYLWQGRRRARGQALR